MGRYQCALPRQFERWREEVHTVDQDHAASYPPVHPGRRLLVLPADNHPAHRHEGGRAVGRQGAETELPLHGLQFGA